MRACDAEDTIAGVEIALARRYPFDDASEVEAQDKRILRREGELLHELVVDRIDPAYLTRIRNAQSAAGIGRSWIAGASPKLCTANARMSRSLHRRSQKLYVGAQHFESGTVLYDGRGQQTLPSP